MNVGYLPKPPNKPLSSFSASRYNRTYTTFIDYAVLEALVVHPTLNELKSVFTTALRIITELSMINRLDLQLDSAGAKLYEACSTS